MDSRYILLDFTGKVLGNLPERCKIEETPSFGLYF